MIKRLTMAAIGVALLHASVAGAADRIRPKQGAPVMGKVTKITPTGVTIELQSEGIREVPVNEIASVSFDEEPRDLLQVRIAANTGRYDDVLTFLEKITPDEVKRGEIKTDLDFYKALAQVRLALGGSGSKTDAGKQLVAFERANPNSHHYFATCEALGDLLVSINRFKQAEAYYAKVAAAPWPDFKMRAGVLMARALAEQKQFDSAITRFDQVLAIDAKGKEADKQRHAAQLGKATALAASGKIEPAVKLVEEVVAKADAEDGDLHARAYNALGNCYLAANKKQDALMAFLHVDLLYAGFAEQHAEALARLSTLWVELNKPERGAQARQALEQRYPNSRWAQKPPAGTS